MSPDVLRLVAAVVMWAAFVPFLIITLRLRHRLDSSDWAIRIGKLMLLAAVGFGQVAAVLDVDPVLRLAPVIASGLVIAVGASMQVVKTRKK